MTIQFGEPVQPGIVSLETIRKLEDAGAREEFIWHLKRQYYMRDKFRINLGQRFSLAKEKPGVIAPVSVWVLWDWSGVWMYVNESLLGLLLQVKKEWKADRHLVG